MSKKSILVSVVVPVYNVSKYLTECVESILRQAYKNLEIILVDDGSTDESGKMCDGFAKRDKRVKVFHKKNEGLGLTRNYGLKKCHGEYAMFLDSDDYISSSLIEELVKSVEADDLDLAKSGYIRITDNGDILTKNNYDDVLYGNSDDVMKFREKFLGSLPDGSDSVEMGVNASLYKMSIVKDYDIKFISERKMISEDLVFNFEFLRHALKVGTVSYLGYYYRYNPDSLSRRYDKTRFTRVVDFYSYMIQLARCQNVSVKGIDRLYKSFFIGVRTCLKQERYNIGRVGAGSIKKNLRRICDNSLVEESIREYPVRKLHLKQRVFIRIVQKKRVGILYFLIRYRVM